MSLQDPIADFLVRIKNGQAADKKSVEMPSSKQKVAIARVLKEEGYITDYSVDEAGNKPVLKIVLKYHDGRPVIEKLKRKSRPSLRLYAHVSQLKGMQRKLLGGVGTIIISTPKGVMTTRAACEAGVGGEILCTVE